MQRGAQNPALAGVDRSALLRELVHSALLSKAKGQDPAQYTKFVREFKAIKARVERSTSEDAHRSLAEFIHALRDCVSVLREQKHDALLGEVLGIKLWSAPAVVRNAVLELLCDMVVANSAFTHTCLQLLVYSLLPPPAPPAADAAAAAAAQQEWKPSEAAAQVQGSVLAAISRVLMLVPTAPTSLLPLVARHMPHKLHDRDTQCLFLSGLYAVAEHPTGAPIRDGLLAAAVEHLLTLDVEIRWQDIVDVPTGEEEEEGESEEEVEDIFEVEGMRDLDINGQPVASAADGGDAGDGSGRGGWEGAASGAGHGHTAAAATAAEASTSGRPAVDETADKLDSMMELTFGHLARRVQLQGGPAQVWDALLAIFERTILHTHRSKFSQFLLFYMCMKYPGHCPRSLLSFLISRLQDSRQPSITRSACAAYIASFLARAAFVPPTLVVQALGAVTDFCHEYCRSLPTTAPTTPSRSMSISSNLAYAVTLTPNSGLHPSSSTGALDQAAGGAAGADALTQKHQVLYASVQAVLYVLCYHMEPFLMGTHSGGASGPHQQQLAAAVRHLVCERIAPLLSHRLQPLAVCLPSVVAEFSHQAAAFKLMDVGALIGQQQPEAGQRSQRPLEMFFPFDPYLLKRSSKHLELRASYVRWRHGHARAGGAAGQGHEESSDEEDQAQAMEEPDVFDNYDVHDDDEDLSSDKASSSSDTSSSSDEEDGNESLRGGSLPSDVMLPRAHALLLHNKRGGTAAGSAAVASAAVAVPGMAAAAAAVGASAPRGAGLSSGAGGSLTGARRPPRPTIGSAPRVGSKRGASGTPPLNPSPGFGAHGARGMPMQPMHRHMPQSGASLGVSYSPGATTCSMDDVMGTSPVVVEYYMGAGHSPYGSSPSPMQMTPVAYTMDAVPSRLGVAAGRN